MGIDVDVIDNSEAFKAAMRTGVEAAVEKIGMQAERNVMMLAPVDTGRLRGSINHESSGDTAYVGTNVEYAPYVEMGHHQWQSGRWVPPQPYLKPGVMDHMDEYRQIAINEIKAHLP